MPSRRLLAAPAILVATLVLTSCGTSKGDGPGAVGSTTPGPTQAATPSATARPTGAGTPAGGAVGRPDVTFATMMIPQDTQVVTMADLALKETTNARLKGLAPQIRNAAVPEIARMSGWFTSVGGVAPGSAGYHDMAEMSGVKKGVKGTLTAKEMTDLTQAKGPAFDRLWLQMMVRNRTGAVVMAREEIAKGGSPDVKAVAQEIIEREPPKIAEMTSILASVTG
jgi:uncharacterized protein (DUF305 family)